MSPKTRKKIAVFGSAVNPPTRAHKALLEHLAHSGYFDRILFFPSGSRPDKPDLLDSTHRVEMTLRALHDTWRASLPVQVHIDLREAFRESIPTAHLLRELDYEFQDDDVIFVTGVDVLAPRVEYGGRSPVAHYWEEGAKMLAERLFAVLPRDGYPHPVALKEQGKLPEHFLVLPPPAEWSSGISSTEVRERIASGLSAHDLLDPEVLEYIEEHKLYRLPNINS